MISRNLDSNRIKLLRINFEYHVNQKGIVEKMNCNSNVTDGIKLNAKFDISHRCVMKYINISIYYVFPLK